MIVRGALPKDASGMAELLNDIIAIGGTTAYQQPTTEAKTRGHAIDGPDFPHLFRPHVPFDPRRAGPRHESPAALIINSA